MDLQRAAILSRAIAEMIKAYSWRCGTHASVIVSCMTYVCIGTYVCMEMERSNILHMYFIIGVYIPVWCIDTVTYDMVALGIAPAAPVADPPPPPRPRPGISPHVGGCMQSARVYVGLLTTADAAHEHTVRMHAQMCGRRR